MKEDICKNCVLLNDSRCTRIDGACFRESLLNAHPIKRGTVDLNKLQEMLDNALAEEAPESFNRWLDEQEKLDKMNSIATTKEQSARLLACGVPPETADMMWLAWKKVVLVGCPNTFDTATKKKATPAWSLSALLEKVLPKQLKDFPLETIWNADGDETELSTPHMLNGDIVLDHNGTIWEVDYGFIGRLPQSKESLIEAVVQAVELLHLNGYEFN